MVPAPSTSSPSGDLTTLAPIAEVHHQIFDDFRRARPLVANRVNRSAYDRITPSLYRHLSITSDNVEGIFYDLGNFSGRKAELLEGAERLTLGFSGEGNVLRRGLEELLGPRVQEQREQASPDGVFILFPNVKEVRLGLAMREPYNRKEYGSIEFRFPFLFPHYQHLTWDIPVFLPPTNREESDWVSQRQDTVREEYNRMALFSSTVDLVTATFHFWDYTAANKDAPPPVKRPYSVRWRREGDLISAVDHAVFVANEDIMRMRLNQDEMMEELHDRFERWQQEAYGDRMLSEDQVTLAGRYFIDWIPDAQEAQGVGRGEQ